jgi:hypothetical protein
MSSFNHKLLQEVLQKVAYVPPGPPAGAAPPMDPAMMAGGGAPMPPMDPAMMGGGAPMPPMDPSMMGGAPPMDPAMMGGMPPMDPSMMGGAPPPMDPSMVGMFPPEGGEAPPMDPAAAGGGMPVILNIDDLRAILAEAGGGGGGAPEEAEEVSPEGEPKRVTNKVIESRIDDIENMLAAIMNTMGIPMQEAPAMTEEVPVEAPLPPMPPEGGMMGAPGPIGPMEQPIGEMEMPIDMPKQASRQGSELLETLKKMNSYR